MKPQLVIPMTGISSRFTAAGYKLPKFLLEVDGQTVVDHVIDMFPDWEDVIFCCNEIHLDNPDLDLEAHLLRRRPKAKIVRVADNRQGPGWAVLQARHLINLDRPVVVNYCDFTCYWNSDDLAQELYSGNVDGCIPAYTGFHPHMAFSTSYAYLKIDNGKVVDIQEKQPWTDTPHDEYASSGTYGFASGKILLDALDAQVEEDINLKGEYYLSLTYKPLLSVGGRVSVLAVQHFMQWGTPQDFEEYKDVSRALSEWDKPRAGLFPLEGLSRVVLASGAGSRFQKEGYDLPKPALPLSGKSLLEHSLGSVPGENTVVVTRTELGDHGLVARVASNVNAELVTLTELSRGQAESALFGLKALTTNSPVTVTACDAISVIDPEQVSQAFNEVGEDGLVVWVARPYNLALRKPEQYGWVSMDKSGMITNSWIKNVPDIPDAGVIVGTFGFGSSISAINHIEQLISDKDTVNGEFYLDSLVQRLISSGHKVKALLLDSFVSVGTPAEYESVLYWQSCFHKWAHHPYKLASDQTVSAIDRMSLDKQFREFITFPMR